MGKFIRIAFYTVGTFLLLFSSIIVGANFVRDSGVFDKEVVAVKKQPEKVQAAASTTPQKIIVESEPVEKEPVKQSDTSTTAARSEKLAVEVINCTDNGNLAEDTRGMLEARGFSVSIADDPDKSQGTSRIIIRKKGVSASVIKNVLKIQVVKEELQPDSRFDVTVVIGSDFNP